MSYKNHINYILILLAFTNNVSIFVETIHHYENNQVTPHRNSLY